LPLLQTAPLCDSWVPLERMMAGWRATLGPRAGRRRTDGLLGAPRCQIFRGIAGRGTSRRHTSARRARLDHWQGGTSATRTGRPTASSSSTSAEWSPISNSPGFCALRRSRRRRKDKGQKKKGRVHPARTWAAGDQSLRSPERGVIAFRTGGRIRTPGAGREGGGGGGGGGGGHAVSHPPRRDGYQGPEGPPRAESVGSDGRFFTDGRGAHYGARGPAGGESTFGVMHPRG